jgi:predicted glycogen debranching enzyme
MPANASPPSLAADEREWLEADGRGGFASGTVNGVRTRRYHGLLLAATTPPTGRMMLVNDVEVWIESGDRRWSLSSHRYAEAVIHPDGASRLVAFAHEPWPRWKYRTDDGVVVIQELYVRHGRATSVMTWTLAGPSSARLTVRPLLSGRDYHALHHENAPPEDGASHPRITPT